NHTAFEEVPQGFGRFFANQLLAFARRGGNVRRGDDLRQFLQTWVNGRLLLEYVETGASYLSGFDRICQRLLVDEIATRGVDDAKTLLGFREPLGVHQLPRLSIRRHVERHVVGTCEEFVDRDELNTKVGRDLFGDERIVRDH